MTNSKKLLVMRGIPGAGKSTLVSSRAPSAVVCSADHFFTQPDGRYVFDGSKLGRAHDQCYATFLHAVSDDVESVAVDNTNLTWKSMSRYVEGGLDHGYEVELLDVITPHAVAAARCVHNVPASVVQKLAASQLTIPQYIIDNPKFKHTIVK